MLLIAYLCVMLVLALSTALTIYRHTRVQRANVTIDPVKAEQASQAKLNLYLILALIVIAILVPLFAIYYPVPSNRP